MTQMDLFQNVTSSQPDTHANRSALPEIEEVKKMTDTSGQKYLALLKPKDQLGAYSKTFMATSLWVSTKCYLIWKGKTTPSGRLLFQLAPLTHPTEETEFGSSPEMWRTPDTGQGGTSGLLKQGKTHRENGQPIQVRLVDQVNNPKLWPTPRACTAMSAENIHNRINDKNPNLETVVARTIWPTPTVQDRKNNGGASQHERNTKPLNAEVGGSLNPQWVEWLMGYPEGWTDLKD